MKAHYLPFMGEEAASSFEASRVVVLPFPYERGVSFGKGAAGAPEAILKSSAFVELYDEFLCAEPFKKGIFTGEAPAIPEVAEDMLEMLRADLSELIEQDKFVVLLGGDHSISSAYVEALLDKFGTLSVVQFDAHADLRDSFEGSRLSHACVMSRIRESTTNTIQLGLRSLSIEEAKRIDAESLQVCMMRQFRDGGYDIRKALDSLPDPVFITFDVDVLDWSVVRSTGTPEPGGMTWDEATDILQLISESKRVAGFDIVELSANESDRNSPFAVARLAYRMIGMFA